MPLLSPLCRRASAGVMRLVAPLVAGATLLAAPTAHAFCGFYVGRADAGLFNRASQVIMARDGDRTVISMANDYSGPLDEFALVVPVPTVLKREQVHVGDPAIFTRVDGWSAPRLTEYHDDNPCAQRELERLKDRSESSMKAAPAAPAPTAAALGVKVEEQFSVGEYDIVILSATESDGLETWLTGNGYRLPAGASKALAPYIRQGLKFFVAKVNLKNQARSGSTKLRPLQFAFESRRFMLPLRLGMLNAQGPQDLVVYMLTRQGRVEASNYRTVKLPANMDLPVGIRGDFGRFYQALFDRQWAREGGRVVFTEHFWNMGWCDPCAADPLTPDELRSAGVFWINPPGNTGVAGGLGRNVGQQVMLTRLHLRYTRDTFPEDLAFIETADQQNFQTRYVLRHPYTGVMQCSEAEAYRRQVKDRQQKEALALHDLTGWPLDKSRQLAGLRAAGSSGSDRWWSTLWE
ncbi:DUF2330 domain-containing protein [Ideonella sp. DXS29W]|uniref:DUF2330 domain-containing protein n=1 Tax=Ideonella lacteola TaxID=2984193 RepID=A0ABU9BKD7_9BURK